MANTETIVRTYLGALKNPESLRDDEAITKAKAELEKETDPISRLALHEKLRELTKPSIDKAEEDFVVHAKAWADERGISADSFLAEGVPSATLRRAGFPVGRGRTPRGRSSGTAKRASSGSRVTTGEVLGAMPTGGFTIKRLQELSGASAQVVRAAVKAEVKAGRLADVGSDPDHSGPGRAPRLYRKS